MLKTYVTPEQYLALERKAEYKSEYYDGEVYAMSGAKMAHNRIARNLLVSLATQLRGTSCEALGSDMRVQAGATSYCYPDLTGVCGQPQLADHHLDVLLNPTLIVEILSPSTEAFDRGEKFRRYRSLKSLQQYLLVSQDRMAVDVYTLRDGDWVLKSYEGAEGVVGLDSVGCQVRLADIYEKVELSPPAFPSPDPR